MPIISKHQRKFGGDHYLAIVRVDSEGTFSITLPEVVATYFEVEVAKGPTKIEAEKEWSRLIEEFEKINQKTRKVIHYEIQTHNHRRWSSDQGLKIEIAADVFLETEMTTPDCGKKYIYKDISNEIEDWPEAIRGASIWSAPVSKEDRPDPLIDFTPITMQFFIDLSVNMEAMVNKIEKFMSKPKNIQNYIAGTTFLLEPPAKKKAQS